MRASHIVLTGRFCKLVRDSRFGAVRGAVTGEGSVFVLFCGVIDERAEARPERFELFKQERLRALENGTAILWGINYPLAFREYVTKSAAANGLPESLVYSIIRAESTFSPTALSPAGAVGLMQLMPETARQYAVAGETPFLEAYRTNRATFFFNMTVPKAVGLTGNFVGIEAIH